MEMKSVTAAATNKKVSNKYIPDDIVFSILSKLRLKSFKRFECVRKSWSLLFENHHFMNMFRNNFLSNYHRCSYYDGASLLLKVYEPNQEVLYSLSGERFENKVKLDFSNPFTNQNYFHIFGLGSVNGTLLLHDAECCYYKLVLSNLATDEFKVIPPSPVESIQSSIPDVAKNYVMIDAGAYHHGFGYDSVTDDYKVIRYVDFFCDIFKPMKKKTLNSLLGDISLDSLWEIYSLRDNSWRKLNIDMPYSLEFNEGTQVYMDGVCHWLCQNNVSGVGPCLVSFYLSNEEFFTTPIPSDMDGCFDAEELSINLVLLNGSIALFAYDDEITATFHISILGELGKKESWTKLFIVGPLSCVVRPIGVGMKGEIFFIRKDNELAWFDLSTQMIELLRYKIVGSSCRIYNNLQVKHSSNNWRIK